MTTSVTRSCFTKQHQTCKTKTKTKTTACKTKTKTDFLVSDRSCPKTGGLRPHHWLPATPHRALERRRLTTARQRRHRLQTWATRIQSVERRHLSQKRTETLLRVWKCGTRCCKRCNAPPYTCRLISMFDLYVCMFDV